MNEDAKLHDAARRLGVQAAERLDVERVAARVVERLRDEPVRPTRPAWMQPAWLRIAAAVVLLVGGGLVWRQAGNPAAPHGAHFVTDDLTDLSADQLRDVLNTLDETLNLGSTTLPDGDLDDLDAQQLQAVLRSLEG
ncbi:MAG TPA: hypothetical protein VKC15_19030 [Gemmatimonadales bacterium]|nr:hypothetical protein [Gemmatimonadales bacterium]